MLQNLQVSNLTIQYPSSPAPLFSGLDVCFSAGWTGISGVNGAGKTSLLQAICAERQLPAGTVQGLVTGPAFRYYCPQRTDNLPEHSDDFITALYEQDSSAGKLSSILAVDHSWYYRWDSLSFGERKRFQLAVALWLEPDVLAVDEPTNHLDSAARRIVADGLITYRGTGLIVSHDRELMDRLCFQTLFVSPPVFTLKPGGISLGLEEIRKENLSAERESRNSAERLKALKKEEHKRRELAAAQQRRRSKKGLAIKDHDARQKLNLARVSGKDGTGGRLLRQMQGRVRQSEDHRTRAIEKKQLLSGLSGPSKGKMTIHSRNTGSDFLLSLDSGSISPGEGVELVFPDLEIQPGQRICLTGPNGSGKTSLLNTLFPKLLVPQEFLLYLPQELAVDDYHGLRQRLDRLSSGEKGEIIGAVSRLGSDPHRILDSPVFSPGEARKLLLAFSLQKEMQLIILDEPTNHLDLVSIMALETALGPLDCAMLIVSHDTRFRTALCSIEWQIHTGQNTYRLQVR
ncbi:MAG: ABC-F family ATP-binding cassette domain-containing protein [Spirochaetales bacterium]|nr:ABC-F family ATP-binding cassette domain-containing protein [Spirochaetales bacterium]